MISLVLSGFFGGLGIALACITSINSILDGAEKGNLVGGSIAVAVSFAAAIVWFGVFLQKVITKTK